MFRPKTRMVNSRRTKETSKGQYSEQRQIGLQLQDLDEIEDPVSSEAILFSADREGIKSAIMEMAPKLQECYDGWSAMNEHLHGRIMIAFDVLPNEQSMDQIQAAETASAQIEAVQVLVDEVAHPMLTSCLLNLIEGLTFENVEKSVNVRYPFQFSKTPSSN